MTSAGKKFGIAGLVIVVVLLAVAAAFGRLPRWLVPAKRGNGWNSHAIEGTLSGVQVRELDPSNAALVFFYDLDNQTDTDFQMAPGSSLLIMGRLKSDGSLSADELITLASAAFVPARNRTRIAIQVTHPFTWPQDTDGASGDKFRGFLQGEVTNLTGFVLFDQPTKYQIELPGDWKDLPQIPAVAGRN
jgi:hypothetical protein